MKPQSSSRMHRAAGFSLVELLTAITIVGILAAIAVPGYTSQTRKSRRTEARTALLDLAGREERLFSTTNAYSAAAADLGYSSFASVGSGYYKVEVTAAVGPPATYSIKATPIAGKGQEKDTQCASFTVTQTGKQAATDSSDTEVGAKCWG